MNGRPWSRCIAAAMLGGLACGCGSSHTARPVPSDGGATAPHRVASTRVAIRVDRHASPATFVADVKVPLEGGSCRKLARLRGDGYRLVYAVGDGRNPKRRIELTYDAAGELTQYADERGDLRARVAGADGGPPRAGEPVRFVPPTGRRTSVLINLERGKGLAMNDGGREPREAVAGAAGEMLAAGNLGTPARTIEWVERTCGAGDGRR